MEHSATLDTVGTTAGILISLFINFALQVYIALKYINVVATEHNEMSGTQAKSKLDEINEETTTSSVRSDAQTETTICDNEQSTIQTDLARIPKSHGPVLQMITDESLNWNSYLHHLKGSLMLQMEALLGMGNAVAPSSM